LKHLHYSWVIVGIATCILATHAIAIFTFGIFLIPLTTEFAWDRGALSGAYSVFWLISGFLGIFTGRLSDKYGPRILVTLSGLLSGLGFLLMSQINSLWQVYLIWGFLIGVGDGCHFIPVTSTIPRWFVKRRGIALGIVFTGLALGAIISPPLAQWLISAYGWQQSFFILGLIIFIIIIPIAQFMKHSPQRIGLKPYGENQTIEDKQSLAPTTGGFYLRQAIKTSHFWVFGLILASFLFIIQVIIVHIIPHAVDTGISEIAAASILSIIGISSIIGRLSVGSIADRIGDRLVLSACLVMTLVALIWLLFTKEIGMFYVFATVFGFAYGGVATLQAMVAAELFGLKSLGLILGGVFFLATIGGALGAPLAGSIFDVTGSYSFAFLISVMVNALAIILSLTLLRSKGKENAVTE